MPQFQILRDPWVEKTNGRAPGPITTPTRDLHLLGLWEALSWVGWGRKAKQSRAKRSEAKRSENLKLRRAPHFCAPVTLLVQGLAAARCGLDVLTSVFSKYGSSIWHQNVLCVGSRGFQTHVFT